MTAGEWPHAVMRLRPSREGAYNTQPGPTAELGTRLGEPVEQCLPTLLFRTDINELRYLMKYDLSQFEVLTLEGCYLCDNLSSLITSLAQLSQQLSLSS